MKDRADENKEALRVVIWFSMALFPLLILRKGNVKFFPVFFAMNYISWYLYSEHLFYLFFCGQF